MVFGERADRAADTGVDDELEQRQRRAHGVRAQRERWGGGQEAVHDVKGIGSKADKEEKLRTLLDGFDHALDRDCA